VNRQGLGWNVRKAALNTALLGVSPDLFGGKFRNIGFGRSPGKVKGEGRGLPGAEPPKAVTEKPALRKRSFFGGSNWKKGKLFLTHFNEWTNACLNRRRKAQERQLSIPGGDQQIDQGADPAQENFHSPDRAVWSIRTRAGVQRLSKEFAMQTPSRLGLEAPVIDRITSASRESLHGTGASTTGHIAPANHCHRNREAPAALDRAPPPTGPRSNQD